VKISPTLLIAPLIDFITGKIIESGTAGDGTKMAARAKELIAVNAALLEINQGDTTGIASLQAALNTSSLTPGEALAIQALFATIGNQVTLLNSVAGGTIIGQAATAIATDILNAGTACAQAYVTKYGTPAA